MSDATAETVPNAGREQKPAMAPGDAVDRYVLAERLGAGGMGVVYAAHDPDLDRRVAIKLVLGGSVDLQPRLLREAQAMARLHHPNVITVHDVGVHAGQVFVAMELIDGGTLRAWLEADPKRPWREVLAVVTAAGRGLAAAHSAGVDHRDFKPENVLVARDGRVVVTDFGLARVAGDRDEEETVMGTPAYMAPEQHLGRAADARSDQFSFCLVLYQALYRAPAFRGEGNTELSDTLALASDVVAGRVEPPPARSGAPRWLAPIIMRGLAADPDARWPSMAALLDAIAAVPRRRRRWQWAAGVLLVTSGAVVAWQLTSRDAATCAGGPDRLAGIWDDDVRARVRAGMVASRAPYADEAWQTVSNALDGWRRDWLAMYGESCRATRVRGDQSELALDLRTACLDRRRDEVRALTAALTSADATAVEAAPQAARKLASVAECGDVERLGRDVRLPADPAQRARVESLQARLRDVQAAIDLATIDRAEAAAPAALAAARAADFPLLHAEADFVEGLVAEARADYPRAAKHFEAAVWAAEAVGDDRLKQKALYELAWTSWTTGDFAAGERWLSAAEATLERRGSPLDEQVTLMSGRASLLSEQGKHDEARVLIDEALRLSRSAPGSNQLAVAKLLANTALKRMKLGDHDEGRARMREAMAIFEAELGANHPNVGKLLQWTGASFYQQGNHEAAQPPLERALVLFERAYGPDHPQVSKTLVNLGLVAMGKGDHARAIELLERALGIAERTFGPESSDVANALGNLASAHDEAGHGERSIELFRRALAIYEKTVGKDHPEAVVASMNLALTLRGEGRAAEAVPLLERAVAVLPGKTDPIYLAHAQIELGSCYLDLGQATRAIAPLEAAVAFVTSAEVDPDQRGAATFALAKALWETGRDRPRALSLARDAEAAYEKALGSSGAEGVSQVKAWRAARASK